MLLCCIIYQEGFTALSDGQNTSVEWGVMALRSLNSRNLFFLILCYEPRLHASRCLGYSGRTPLWRLSMSPTGHWAVLSRYLVAMLRRSIFNLPAIHMPPTLGEHDLHQLCQPVSAIGPFTCPLFL